MWQFAYTKTDIDVFQEVEGFFSSVCPKSQTESYGQWRKRIARRFSISPRLVESIHYREIKDLKAQQYKQIQKVYLAAMALDRKALAENLNKNIRVGKTINETLYQEIRGLVSQLIL